MCDEKEIFFSSERGKVNGIDGILVGARDTEADEIGEIDLRIAATFEATRYGHPVLEIERMPARPVL